MEWYKYTIMHERNEDPKSALWKDQMFSTMAGWQQWKAYVLQDESFVNSSWDVTEGEGGSRSIQ